MRCRQGLSLGQGHPRGSWALMGYSRAADSLWGSDIGTSLHPQAWAELRVHDMRGALLYFWRQGALVGLISLWVLQTQFAAGIQVSDWDCLDGLGPGKGITNRFCALGKISLHTDGCVGLTSHAGQGEGGWSVLTVPVRQKTKCYCFCPLHWAVLPFLSLQAVIGSL